MKRFIPILFTALFLFSCGSQSPVEQLISLTREREQLKTVIRESDYDYNNPRIRQAEHRITAIENEIEQLIEDNESYELTKEDRELILQYDQEQKGKKMSKRERAKVLEARTLGGLVYALD